MTNTFLGFWDGEELHAPGCWAQELDFLEARCREAAINPNVPEWVRGAYLAMLHGDPAEIAGQLESLQIRNRLLVAARRFEDSRRIAPSGEKGEK